MSLNFFLVTKVFVCSAILTLCLGIAELVKGGTGIGAAVRPPHRRPEPEQRSLPGPRPVLELPEELGRGERLDTSFGETRRRQHILQPYLGATLEISRL